MELHGNSGILWSPLRYLVCCESLLRISLWITPWIALSFGCAVNNFGNVGWELLALYVVYWCKIFTICALIFVRWSFYTLSWTSLWNKMLGLCRKNPLITMNSHSIVGSSGELDMSGAFKTAKKRP